MEIAFSLCLPRDESSVAVVRHLCTTAMTQFGVEDACIHDVAVAVTEACTNVLQHAHGQDQYDVEIRVSEEQASIRVSDVGEGFDYHALVRDSGSYGPMEERGRGLVLMRALVDELEFVSDPEKGNLVRLTKRLETKDPSIVPKRSGSARATGEVDRLQTSRLRTEA